MNLNSSDDKQPEASPISRWNGTVPLLMSITVLAIITWDDLKHGIGVPRHDESAADHLAILLLFGQLPIIGSFVFDGRKQLRRFVPALLAQLLLWAVAYVAAQF